MSQGNSNSPTKIGKYTRVDTLGKGAYGEVSLFRYNDTDYAIKRVSMMKPLVTLTEVSMLTLLSHPHIMKPYETIPDDDGITLNIVMKKISDTLIDTVENKKLTNADIKLLMWQLLSALDYMHSNNIIHRDLKPGNILVDGMFPQIIDFGLAKYVFSDDIRYHGYVQTPEYRAPEVFLSKKYDTKIDIFSLGLCMYDMIYGERLVRFPDESYREPGRKGHRFMLQTLITGVERVQADRDIPHDMKRVFIEMVTYNPKKRPSAKEVMAMPWFKEYQYQAPDIIEMPVIEVNTTRINDEMKLPDFKPLVDKCNINEEMFVYAKRLMKKSMHTLASLPADERKEMMRFLFLLTHNIYDEYAGSCSIDRMMYTDIYEGIIPNYTLAKNVYKVFKELGMNIFIL